jgi:hypothetical protein
MSQLLVRDKVAALILVPAGLDRFEVARLWLFLKLENHGAGDAVLDGFRQLPQLVEGVFKQFCHAK